MACHLLLEENKHGNNYSPTSRSYHLGKTVPDEKLYKQVNVSVGIGVPVGAEPRSRESKVSSVIRPRV